MEDFAIWGWNPSCPRPRGVTSRPGGGAAPGDPEPEPAPRPRPPTSCERGLRTATAEADQVAQLPRQERPQPPGGPGPGLAAPPRGGGSWATPTRRGGAGSPRPRPRAPRRGPRLRPAAGPQAVTARSLPARPPRRSRGQDRAWRSLCAGPGGGKVNLETSVGGIENDSNEDFHGN